MLMAHIPEMFVSEQKGWGEIEQSHHSARWYFLSLAMPLSLLPPAMYVYSERMNPGAVFPLSAPPMTSMELGVVAIAFFVMELAMVAYLAMLIQRMTTARDHDPGYDAAYALATIAPIPLWFSSLALLVPSLGFVMVVAILAWFGAAALIRHGVRPLLHVADEKRARYIANLVTLSGAVAWICLLFMTAMLLSMFIGFVYPPMPD